MPLSLLYLSGTSKAVADTTILDLNVEKSKRGEDFDYVQLVKDEVTRLCPDVVGITCLFSGQINYVFVIATAVKEVNPSIITISGGFHPTLYHKEILENFKDLDAIAIGEGEAVLRDVLTTDCADWHKIAGLGFRDETGAVICNDVRRYEENLDSMPRPAYELFDFSNYDVDVTDWYNPKRLKITHSVPILSSRSCPFKCNFCAMHLVMGTIWRDRSAKSIFDEIKYLHDAFDVRYFNIMDDNFSLSKKRTQEFCKRIIDSGINISFDVPNGIMTQTLDDTTIDLLAAAGFAYCFLAIESGSAYIRNEVMNKHLKQEKIYEVVTSLRRHQHIHILVFLIMGMPEDTNETVQETYDLMNELDVDDFKVSVATPFPGTKLFDQCVQDGLLINYDKNIQLWKTSTWHQQILNENDLHFYIKPYNMALDDLKNWADRFEKLRHKKHLYAVKSNRRTLSITHALRDFYKLNPEYVEMDKHV